jgi:hypothetical protein
VTLSTVFNVTLLPVSCAFQFWTLRAIVVTRT